jgi:hypothetical protein
MPVWVYLVEHPEGVWLIDAGASPRYRDPQAWSFDPDGSPQNFAAIGSV